jgi:hypothetical protein
VSAQRTTGSVHLEQEPDPDRAGWWDRITTPAPTSWRERLLVLLLLGAVAVVTFEAHVRRSGFIMDDWSNAAKTRFLASCCGPGATGQGAGYLVQAENLLNDGPAAYHIGLPALIPPVFALFRPDVAPHLALAVAFGVLLSAAFHLVLRELGIPALHAALMAALVLVFPFSDSTRLWPMAGYNQLAGALWLVGVVLALRGLRRTGRPAVLLHAAALACYATGIVIYELTAGPVLVTALLYLRRRPGGGLAWRPALVRWAADLAVMAGCLVLVVSVALPRAVVPLGQQVRFGLGLLDDTLTLLARIVVPVGDPPRLLVLLPLAGLAAWAVTDWRRTPSVDPYRTALGRWLLVAGGSAVFTAAGYAMAVPGGYAGPLSAGIENRVNMLSALGYVGLLYALAALLALLVARLAGRVGRLSAAAPAVLALLLLAVWIPQVRTSAADYTRSSEQQQQVLDALAQHAPWPKFAIVHTFGHPTFVSPGVPVFAWLWDLTPAMKVSLEDPSPAAYPVLPGSRIVCDRRVIHQDNDFLIDERAPSKYRNTFFLDVPTGRLERIDDRRQCEAVAREFAPGPLSAERPDCRLVGEGPATRLPWQCPEGLIGSTTRTVDEKPEPVVEQGTDAETEVPGEQE